MPVPGSAFLIAMGGADGTVHVQHDILEPVAIMKPVDPMAVQIGQRRPVLGQGQRSGLEPPHLRRRGRLCIDSLSTHDLTDDRIEGQTVSVVYVLVPGQSPEHRLPEKAVKLMDRVLAASGVTQCCCRQFGQPERVTQLAYHQKADV